MNKRLNLTIAVLFAAIVVATASSKSICGSSECRCRLPLNPLRSS